MSNDAWNKVTQTHDLFKKIIAPLKQHLGINFGYMIAFNDGSYYQSIENLECLKKWVTNVETSSIFCARNVTSSFDGYYNFTIWPEEPTCSAMKIYKEFGMWNGMTVSKMNKDYTELYWFTKQNAEDGFHRFFIRNKQFLVKFIDYFRSHKKSLFIPASNNQQELFKFKRGFDLDIVQSEYIKNESTFINEAVGALILDPMLVSNFKETTRLSSRELEVLSIIGIGHTAKTASNNLNISIKTIDYHIANIKRKLQLNFKSDLIQYYSTLR